MYCAVAIDNVLALGTDNARGTDDGREIHVVRLHCEAARQARACLPSAALLLPVITSGMSALKASPDEGFRSYTFKRWPGDMLA